MTFREYMARKSSIHRGLSVAQVLHHYERWVCSEEGLPISTVGAYSGMSPGKLSDAIKKGTGQYEAVDVVTASYKNGDHMCIPPAAKYRKYMLELVEFAATYEFHKKRRRKNIDVMDSGRVLPGSFEGGKRR
jgi:hypothetical protein